MRRANGSLRVVMLAASVTMILVFGVLNVRHVVSAQGLPAKKAEPGPPSPSKALRGAPPPLDPALGELTAIMEERFQWRGETGRKARELNAGAARFQGFGMFTAKSEDVEAFVNQASWAMAGPDVVKLRLTEAGAESVAQEGTWILAANVHSTLYLSVKNERKVPVKLSVARQETDKLAVSEGSVEVKPGTTRVTRLTIEPRSVGALSTSFEVTDGDKRVRLPVKGEVKPSGKLRVTLKDSDGDSSAARIYLAGADERFHAPVDATMRYLKGEPFFHAEAEFIVELPEGNVEIEAVRGFEYEPAHLNVQAKANAVTECEINLKRRVHMARDGWYSGDMHVHMNYTDENPQWMKPANLLVMAKGEDLNYVNGLVANSRSGFVHDQQYFEGKPHALSSGDYILFWGEEMRNASLWGHMCLTGITRLAEPIFTGFQDTESWADFPPNYDMAAQGQKAGGVVSYAHPIFPPGEVAQYQPASAKELPVDIALGVIDAMDVFSNANEIASRDLWYHLLNAGFRCAISAGTDSFTNIAAQGVLPGANRVYVHAGPNFTYKDWIENYRKGKTFATNGPMIWFTVNGEEAGTELQLQGPNPKVKVESRFSSWVPVESYEVVVNGQVVAQEPVPAGQSEMSISKEITLPGSGWVAVRVQGPGHRYVTLDPLTMAHSGPVYCIVDGKPIRSKPDIEFCIDWIDQLMAEADKVGMYMNDDQKKQTMELLRKGQDVYRKMAGEG